MLEVFRSLAESIDSTVCKCCVESRETKRVDDPIVFFDASSPSIRTPGSDVLR